MPFEYGNYFFYRELFTEKLTVSLKSVFHFRKKSVQRRILSDYQLITNQIPLNKHKNSL